MRDQTPTELPDEQNLFKRLKPPFEQSGEELWDKLEKSLTANGDTVDSSQTPGSRRSLRRRFRLVAAAAILILAGLSLSFRFYTKTITCPKGQMMTISLPDGSTVTLNADSRLEYHPLWWWASRTAHLEGEAFFEVEKGSRFSIHSEIGTTNVLGTSFNISTRNSRYEVYCQTGKVEVVARQSGEKAILRPGMLAKLDTSLVVQEHVSAREATDWRAGYFSFKARPLKEILEEIARHYDISIKVEADRDMSAQFSAHFRFPVSPDSALMIIGANAGFQYIQESDQSFQLLPQNSPTLFPEKK